MTSNIEGAVVVGASREKFLEKIHDNIREDLGVCRSTVNTTAHLNRARVKRSALEIAAQIRPANKFTRVGMSFIERIEAKVRAAIREEVRIHPSKGKTLL